MKIQSAKAKGKLLENWIVERLRISGLDIRAYRQKGSGNGLNKSDIWNDLNLAIECKNQKKFSNQWSDQVKKDSLGVQIPVIVWHPPQRPLEDSTVMIGWSFFEELLLKWKAPNLQNPDREFKYKLQRFVNFGKDLLKEFE